MYHVALVLTVKNPEVLAGGGLSSCHVLARLHFLGLSSKISQKWTLCKAESLQVETGEVDVNSLYGRREKSNRFMFILCQVLVLF